MSVDPDFNPQFLSQALALGQFDNEDESKPTGWLCHCSRRDNCWSWCHANSRTAHAEVVALTEAGELAEEPTCM